MTNPSVSALKSAHWNGDDLIFESDDAFERALDDGCFYLAIPEGIDLAPAVRLARNFYRFVGEGDPDPIWCNFRGREGIYFDREHYQTEHILADEAQRRTNFPAPALEATEAMTRLTQVCLRSVLARLGIAPTIWQQVTGGASHGMGTHWFAFSHYRSDRDQLGCAPHQDTGFLTILYIDQPGLEALTPVGWQSIDPVEGHFVVNFGASLEHLTATWRRPVHAILHRVRRCHPEPGREDRFSFAAFANPPASGEQFQIDASGAPVPTGSVEAFLREFNAKTWHDSHDEFGIQ